MKLIKDYAHTFDALWVAPGHCRIRVFRGDNKPAIFICTELQGNQSGSITTVVEWLATEIWEQEGRPDQFVWIEHYPSDVSSSGEETLDEVTFARPFGARFFSPEWKRITRQELEDVIGTDLS